MWVKKTCWEVTAFYKDSAAEELGYCSETILYNDEKLAQIAAKKLWEEDDVSDVIVSEPIEKDVWEE